MSSEAQNAANSAERDETTASRRTSKEAIDGNLVEEKSTADFDPAPEGGLRAWLVVAGGACITFSCLGLANAFGVFQEYYQTHQLRHKSPDDIAWIGSLSAFIQFAMGAIGGPLFDRFGAWFMRPAAVMYIFAVMMISLCTQYWQFMLAHGVLIGVCQALLQTPSFAAASQYFDKKRAAALGGVIAGSSIGGVVFPIALSKMLNSTNLGFGWSVRVLGFMIMPLMLFACVAITPRLPSRNSTFFILSAFKEARFLLLILALFFMFIGLFTPFFFIPSYAVYRGMNATLASYLLAILNAASTFGRVIPGILADKYGRLNIFSFGAVVSGIVILCLNKVESNAALIVYSIIFGFTSGTIISGAITSLADCPKSAKDIGTYGGMGMGLASIASLIGPPVNGVLIGHYGGFSQAAIFSGVCCLVGGCIALIAKAVTPKGIFGRV